MVKESKAQLSKTHSHDGTTVLVATDNCRRLSHRFAESSAIGDAARPVICVTCTEEWGRQAGLKAWQENCPCCFSAAHPNGLTDLGITAALETLREAA